MLGNIYNLLLGNNVLENENYVPLTDRQLFDLPVRDH